MASGGLVGWRMTKYTARQQPKTAVKPSMMGNIFRGPVRVEGDSALDGQVFICVRVDHGKVDEPDVLVDDHGMTFSA